jgi:hypothetical protein
MATVPEPMIELVNLFLEQRQNRTDFKGPSLRSRFVDKTTRAIGRFRNTRRNR